MLATLAGVGMAGFEPAASAPPERPSTSDVHPVVGAVRRGSGCQLPGGWRCGVPHPRDPPRGDRSRSPGPLWRCTAGASRRRPGHLPGRDSSSRSRDSNPVLTAWKAVASPVGFYGMCGKRAGAWRTGQTPDSVRSSPFPALTPSRERRPVHPTWSPRGSNPVLRLFRPSLYRMS